VSTTHACLGGCGAQVPRHHLSCKPCWYRLPAPLRDDVNFAYRHRAANPGEHGRARRAAMTWYRENPLAVKP
jgi:hypothetical protein